MKIRFPVSDLSEIKNLTLVSFLDLSRWLAAAMVFVSHLRNPLLLGYSDVPLPDQTWLIRLWYFATGLHMEAVVVFFVLSGYLVGGLSCAKIGSGNFRLPTFAIDRITRLYIAFLPALLLTYCLDITGNYFFGEVGFWDRSHPMIAQKVNSVAFESLLSPEVIIGNLLMLQGFVVDSLGSNPPLWTISLEFWFYIVFGLIASAYIGAGVARRLFLLGICLVAMSLLGSMFFILFGLWLIGVGVVFVPANRKVNPFFALVLFLLVLAIARFKQGIFNGDELLQMIKNFIVAVSFGFLIVSMRGQSSKLLLSMAKFNNFLAGFSFSLYLIHFPVMLFLLAALYKTGLFPGIKQGYIPTDGVGVILYGFMIIIVYLLAWAFSLVTEAQTWRFRGYLKRKFLT